jgi:hypothetical protein
MDWTCSSTYSQEFILKFSEETFWKTSTWETKKIVYKSNIYFRKLDCDMFGGWKCLRIVMFRK